MRGRNESLFRAVCLSFSALLLVLLLLTDIDIAAEKDKRARLAARVETLAEENELLRARVEQRLSLEAIETYAREKLGMRSSVPGQVVILEKPTE